MVPLVVSIYKPQRGESRHKTLTNFLGISKICGDLMGTFLLKGPGQKCQHNTPDFWDPAHLSLLRRPRGCLGLDLSCHHGEPKGPMTTPNASRLTRWPFPPNPFPSTKELVKEASIMNEAHGICRFTRAKDHILRISWEQGGCINRGLFHYLDVPLEVSKRIVKGSLDEKLPSYELLKMLKNHFSKVTDQ